MPQLPTTLGPLAVPTPQRTVHGYSLSSLEEGNMAGPKALVQGGKDLQDASDAIKKKEDADAVLNAQARENSVQQEAMKYLYDPDSGILNQSGAAALGASGKAREYLQTLRDKTFSDVTNKTARDALTKSFDSINNSVMETVMRHESAQRKGYAGDLASQSGDNAHDAVGLQPNDDGLFEKSAAQATSAAAAREKIEGKPSGFYAKDAVSDLTKTRIESLMNSTDPAMNAQGGAVYDKAMKDGTLNFKAQVDLGHTLKTALPKAQAQAAFQKDYSAAAGDAAPVEVVVAAMGGQESSGMQAGAPGSVAPPGEITTSPKGAKGVMQIMPDTGPEAAKLAGLPWDPKKFNDPGPEGKAYGLALGKAYFVSLYQQFGSTRMALAAYNMGPGYANDVIDGTNKSGKNPKLVKTGPDFDQFIARAPAETQQYVANIMGDVSATSGPPVINLAKAQERAATMEQPVADNYLAMVTAHNSQITSAQKQNQNDVLAKIQPLLEQTNGNIAALPTALLAEASKAGVLDKVQAYKGFTDEAFKNHLDMLDTDTFSAVDLSDPAVRLRLSASDYNSYVKKQSDMVNDPSNAAMSRRVDQAVNYVFQSRLGSQIKGKKLVDGDPNDKNDSDDVALQNKVLRFKALVQAQIMDEYDRTKKVPGSADIFKIADSIITSEVGSKPSFLSDPIGNIFSSQKSASDVTLDDIKPDVRKNIEAARTARNLPITESGVLSDYLMLLKNHGG